MSLNLWCGAPKQGAALRSVSFDLDGTFADTSTDLAGALNALQEAFVSKDGYQCGYCTSGQLNSARALLDEFERGEASVVTPKGAAPKPTDDEIRERMSGNLCRCGAYANIVRAIGSVLRDEGVCS